MPAADLEAFERDFSIALAIVRQRRAWILRDLTHKDCLKAERAKTELVKVVLGVLEGYDLKALSRPVSLGQSTPDFIAR